MTSNLESLLILKIGGSVITDKSQNGDILTEVIDEIANQITDAVKEKPMIIVHGAGSFGHPQAALWEIQKGVSPENAKGVAQTHEAVAKLNREVVSRLQKAGINAVGMHPLHTAFAENGRLIFCGFEQISAMLKLGMVPVLHGDVVMDKNRGACIVSGDQIVPWLARNLGTTEVAIVTKTGGVLCGDKIIPEITRENVSAIDFTLKSEGADVTGAMKGKVNELLDLAYSGIRSRLFAPRHLKDYLKGKKFPHTLIR